MKFIDTFESQRNERTRWEYYIHKLPPWDETTWEQFNANLDKQEEVNNLPVASPKQLEATVIESFAMLQNFDIEGRG